MSQADAPQHRTVLHIGCGYKDSSRMDPFFETEYWTETRLDVDPAVEPDIVASLTDLSGIEDNSYDAIYGSHVIEHLEWHDVEYAFKEFVRVLKPTGFGYFITPNLEKVAEHIAKGELEVKIFDSPAGPITPIDIVYGHRYSIMKGRKDMIHRTGFTHLTLGRRLIECGFAKVETQLNGYDIQAICLMPENDRWVQEQAEKAKEEAAKADV